LISALLFVALAGCSPVAEEPAIMGNNGTFPLQIEDQVGRVVVIEKLPEKIISLSPGNTEILYALGLADSIAGVTEYCDYPEAAKEKPKVGGFSTVDLEKIVEIQPDLVLAGNIHEEEVIPALERLGFPVITIDPKTIGEVAEAVTLVGKATGREEEASQLTDDMNKRVEAVTEKTLALAEDQKPQVLYILWHDPLQTVGSLSRIHEMINLAGGNNIAGNLEENYPTISMESVIMANPQVIIAGGGHGTGEDLTFNFATTEVRLESVAARRDGRVYLINADLTSRPCPRIVDGLEEIAKMIHPEIFNEG